MLPKSCRYIKWYIQNLYLVSEKELDKKLGSLIRRGGVDVTESKCNIEDWIKNKISYHLDIKKNTKTLYVYDYKCNEHFARYTTKIENNNDDITPSECGTELRKVFQDKTGVTLKKAFGTTSSSDIRLCVPKPLYYINYNYCNKTLHNVSGIDVTSMYPSCVKGALPDAHTAIEKEGRIKPTEEYPFAFYLKSHHCAEYGVFDTHDYTSIDFDSTLFKFLCWNSLKKELIYKNVKDEEEITILMKPSKYTFDETIDSIMERKKNGDPLAKAVMNIGLGTLHKNPDKQKGLKRGKNIQSYYHFCAIMQGRANSKQINTMNEIRKNGGIVLQSIVDSIIYIDYCHKEFGINEKILGEYHLDYKRKDFRMANVLNRYVVSDNNELIKIRLSGNFDSTEIKNIEDIDNYNSKEY